MRRLSLLTILFLSFCGTAHSNHNLKISGLANPTSYEGQQWIDSVMNSLSLREKIAQLFMVAAYSNRDQNHIDEIIELIQNEKIGGLCFFQGGAVRQANLTNYYQRISKVPLLISIDAEWGLGMRLDSTVSYPRQMMLGAMDDNRLIYHMGADIARQLKALGVHINFAPVVDVNNNSKNPVINTRAFGENKEMVAQKGLAYMLGLQDNGILACAKHFPGHGDTDVDSHYALPLLTHSFNRIDSIELYPFRRLVQNGVAGVMVGHMEIPSVEPTAKLASSLSYNVVTSMLINDIGFKGLVITDALNMKGVSEGCNPADLNLMALKAGNDIILFPSEVKASITKIEREIKRGRFPEEEIERRCRKVIEAKYRVGLSHFKPIKTDDLVQRVNQTSSELIIRQIAEQAVTVLSNNNDLIPLRGLDTLNVAYVEIGEDQGSAFYNQMALYAPITKFSVNANSSEEQIGELSYDLRRFNLVVFGYHCISPRPQNDFGVTPNISNLISRISRNKTTVLSIFGSPYALEKLDEFVNPNTLIVAYDNSGITQSVVAQLIWGGLSVSGRLPVTASQKYTLGSGFDAGEHIRLKYSIPEELGLKASYFSKIDSIARQAIEVEATPGMQVLVALKGTVIYNKSFGKHTYIDNDLPVTDQSVYDVASVTKIAATLPIVMDLYSTGKMLLSDSLGKYLHLPDTSQYNRLIINDILLHQAGLVPWIPFYLRTLTTLWPKQPIINSQFSELYPYKLANGKFVNRYTFPSRKFFRNEFSFDFPHEVAKGLYAAESIQDSIYSWIYKTPINPKGKYLYSDVGLILLHRAIGNIIEAPQDEYVAEKFYSRLGMSNTLFNPYSKLSLDRIVPTEYDVFFRKQLVWGYVHDPAAALMGGIAGHAGLFSTANDLAKLMQMFLNNGSYGGEQFLPSATISEFTSCVNCMNGVRRGIGFDKPEVDPKKSKHVSKMATSLSYGHAGFTGALVWADPAYDLIYIILSNRVFPEAENNKLLKMDIRTNIQDVVYEAIINEQIGTE
ncbi:MAG: glycoside hydrolase family 3 N-terminal domain-containing protein [Tenuifilaceae bacterium]|nr:glycoside hydrolase family 3 N-terminal domain-containing protein [Tenuifilaceae bacterium]